MNQLLLRQNAHFSVTITVCFRQGIENHTPWKINMEHNHGGLEDDIPFQMGDL